MNQERVARSAFVIGLGNVGSRVLGLVREQVIAALFGATAPTDAFRVALRVPLALHDLLIGGMVSAALVPVFSGYLARGEAQEVRRVLQVLAALVLLVLTCLVAGLIAAAAPLMSWLAAGYPAEVQALSVQLVQLLLPALVVMGLSALLTAYLNAQERFGRAALAVMAFNAGIVVCALALHDSLGIVSLALGVLAGALLQVLLQLDRKLLSFRSRLALTHPGVREVFRLYSPVALGLVVSTIGIAIDTNLASRTGEGNLAAMGFATTLVQFPLGLVATGVSAAVLPTLSRAAPSVSPTTQASAAGPSDSASAVRDYRAALGLGLRLVWLAILPATLGLVALREPVIRLAFQRGAFDETAAARTAAAFLGYAPGLPAAALDQVLIFGFYARRNTITPVLVGVLGVAVYLGVAVSLLGPLGMPGLALANSAQWVTHMVVMALLTHHTLGGLAGLGLGATLWRSTIAGVAMTVTLLGFIVVLPQTLVSSTFGMLVSLSVEIAVSAAVYLGLLRRLAPDDFNLLVGAVARRFVRNSPQ